MVANHVLVADHVSTRFIAGGGPNAQHAHAFQTCLRVNARAKRECRSARQPAIWAGAAQTSVMHLSNEGRYRGAASATASPQGDMISVQPMFTSPSRSTAAGHAKAYGKLVRTAVVVGNTAANASRTFCGSVRSAVAFDDPLMSIRC